MKKITSIALVSLFAFSMMTSAAFAQISIPSTVGGTFGLGTQDLYSTLTGIVNVLLGFLGVLAIIVILVGGFKWMTSGGNEEKVAGARQMIVAGIIGLAIILAAFAIVQFVVNNVA
jgi:hypothetical protein